jgi:hypothetical protein
MKGLLFTVMILLAAVALPANAQNGTEIAPALENAADISQGYTQTYETAADPLTVAFGGDPRQDYLLAITNEDISQDQPTAEGISEEGAISSLETLNNEAGHKSNENSPNSAVSENQETGNPEQLSQEEQLNQTASTFDQSVAEFQNEEGDYATLIDKVFSPDANEVLKIYEQSDVHLVGGRKDNIVGEDGSLTKANLSQSNITVRDIKNDMHGASIYRLENDASIGEQTGISTALSISGSPKANDKDIRDPYYKSESNLNRLIELTKFPGTPEQDVSDIFTGIDMQLGFLLNIDEGKDYHSSINIERDAVQIDVAERTNFGNAEIASNKPKDYAVVVGINQYSDRRSLHASVNDAQEMASLLGLYGYEVILLTDDTEDKPIKHNILDGALAEIRSKPNLGKVVVYFSGHSEKDKAGNFYLIPRDADGDISSYISEEELSRSIKGIKDLSLIVDACHSEELKGAIGEGQWLLASSMDDEPSNENWMDSSSVFTYNLCEAIKERPKWGGELSFQDYFTKAREETIKWSIRHFLSQTPISCTNMNGSLYYMS